MAELFPHAHRRPAAAYPKAWLAALLLICSGIHPLNAQQGAEASDTEYQVYNAVLGHTQFPKQGLHIVIGDTTLNSGCGADSHNPVLVNSCGIWAPPSSAEQVAGLLRKSWPDMAAATWDDFIGKSSASVKLTDNFKTSWPHKVVDLHASAPPSDDWKSPDGAIFLSRVGLGAGDNEALVYVLFFSYTKDLQTSGDFFLFRRSAGKPWTPVGRVNYLRAQ